MTTTLAPGFPGALNREKSESITWRSGVEARGVTPHDTAPAVASTSNSAECARLTMMPMVGCVVMRGSKEGRRRGHQDAAPQVRPTEDARSFRRPNDVERAWRTDRRSGLRYYVPCPGGRYRLDF